MNFIDFWVFLSIIVPKKHMNDGQFYGMAEGKIK